MEKLWLEQCVRERGEKKAHDVFEFIIGWTEVKKRETDSEENRREEEKNVHESEIYFLN